MAERLTIGNCASEGGRFRTQVKRLRAVVHDAEGDVLATSTDAVSTAALAWAAWAEGRRIVFAPTTQSGSIEVVTTGRELIVLDGTEAANGAGGSYREVPPDDETVLAEFHTSGSSGQPVRWAKRGRQLVGEARFLIEAFGITSQDVVLNAVPACHLYGFLFSVMVPAVVGCDLVDATPLYPETTVRLAEETSATVLVCTPSKLRALAAADPFPSVRRVFSSGAPLSATVRDQLLERGMQVTEIFGSTETGGVAWREGAESWTPFGPVDVREQSGLLHVRSPFLDDPDTWFAMNDRVEFDANGGFRHLGRSDDIAKVGAKRVSKEALRGEFLKFEHVTDVAIGQLADGDRPGALHAFVTTAGDVSADDLRQHLTRTFDPVTIPRIHFVDELPRTALGKISQAAIPKLISQSEREIEFGPPVQDGDDFTVPMVVARTCRYFDGHFDDAPILPGVVQLAAVEQQIAELWPNLTGPVRLERIKFHAAITPGMSLDLHLTRTDSGVSFRIVGVGESRSSGRFIYA